ncbi:CYFA0S04e05446g1_1 [Cyberlindnera fabianii]|uniref:Signal peptidase complex catalytic subunit SEC11 n=1 Tax=Cyberlindnera fabianii TaxID=36022 RepID=A0A061ARB6_CYBFA|nr:CYFA0S04e05446g1_1 [Cyberlindnera fabianii]
MQLRKQLESLLSLIYVVTTAYMFWKGLGIVTNSSSPIVVVLSGSMEPAFQRGDVLFLWNRNERSNVGDVVVYEVNQKPIPIVHRVLREHHNDKKQLLLTKGDNNPVDDLGLYAYGQSYLNKEKDIVGTVWGYFPMVGYITILISENQYFKYGLLGLMGISTLLSNEE